ncbi:MAG: hypothetical protein P8182_11070 [Deltaproteobacteria bacterium]
MSSGKGSGPPEGRYRYEHTFESLVANGRHGHDPTQGRRSTAVSQPGVPPLCDAVTDPGIKREAQSIIDSDRHVIHLFAQADFSSQGCRSSSAPGEAEERTASPEPSQNLVYVPAENPVILIREYLRALLKFMM